MKRMTTSKPNAVKHCNFPPLLLLSLSCSLEEPFDFLIFFFFLVWSSFLSVLFYSPVYIIPQRNHPAAENMD